MTELENTIVSNIAAMHGVDASQVTDERMDEWRREFYAQPDFAWHDETGRYQGLELQNQFEIEQEDQTAQKLMSAYSG